MLTILIADDHPLFRKALRGMLRAVFGEMAVIEADSLADAQARVDDDLDLVLLDLSMADATGFDALLKLRRQAPSLPIIIVSGYADVNTVRQAATMGAAGFIPKTADLKVFAAAVTAVLDGGQYWPSATAAAEPAPADSSLNRLSRSETRVLELMVEGKSNKQIAYELNVKETTVKSHVTSLLRKLEVQNRIQAVLLAKSLGGS